MAAFCEVEFSNSWRARILRDPKDPKTGFYLSIHDKEGQEFVIENERLVKASADDKRKDPEALKTIAQLAAKLKLIANQPIPSFS